ncbi:MAG: 5'-nucleotidase C-terminal domain-containing protein [Gammaproteobacteria bacterium]|nr:5'-nucleotidase C-terminal domain-containing protein [Gammaproteobacteria bacterium]MDH5309033.1 5'-nucleotidase C-terminal domain-containing protein [Gammaproteobacteria bacterium]
MTTFRLLFITLLLGACASAGTVRTPADAGITFIHLNDTYRVGAVEDDQRGGFGRVTTVVRQALAEGRDVRVLHGGDFLYPSLESQLWGGEQMVEAFNFMHRLAPMTVVPGNHEFDPRSPETLVAALRGSEFAWLADNLALATGDAEADARLRQAHVAEIGGRRVGMFALTLLPDDGGNERDYLAYEPGYVEQAENAIVALEQAGAELIVGITHLHVGDDLEIAKLKASHPRFQFIVGGHEHEPEHHPGSAAAAEVMKGASNARQVWRIDVDFDASGMPAISTRMLDLDASVPLDAEYQPIADRWRARLVETIPFLPARIGEAAVPLDGREVTVRNEESNLGNFIVDQMRTAFGSPPADLALINSGTLRIDDYVADDITFEDIARVFAFSSYLRYLDMSGGEFRATLEAGYRGTGPSKGYFPQVSGFRVCVDRSRPDGERVVQLQVPAGTGWAEIEPERLYSVVAPDFILRGGDGYAFPENRPRSRPGSELKYLVLDAIIRAQAAGEPVGAPVDPSNPRIAFVTAPGGRCFD